MCAPQQGEPIVDVTATVVELPALPPPRREGDTSVERALQERRSIREYGPEPLTLSQVGQLLWAAQGISDEQGHRTAPSAGALYPLEVYLVAGNVERLGAGVYHYRPRSHFLNRVLSGDRRRALQPAALDQEAVGDAPAVIVLAALYERTTGKYGDRGIRYVHMEVGAAAENVYLQAVALQLGTVFIGAFYDDQVQEALQLADDKAPLALLPVGHPAGK